MSIHVKIPETLVISELELKMTLAAQLFNRGIISSGQGAIMVGVSKRTFIELLGKHEVSVFQYDMDEIIEDFNNA